MSGACLRLGNCLNDWGLSGMVLWVTTSRVLILLTGPLSSPLQPFHVASLSLLTAGWVEGGWVFYVAAGFSQSKSRRCQPLKGWVYFHSATFPWSVRIIRSRFKGFGSVFYLRPCTGVGTAVAPVFRAYHRVSNQYIHIDTCPRSWASSGDHESKFWGILRCKNDSLPYFTDPFCSIFAPS